MIDDLKTKFLKKNFIKSKTILKKLKTIFIKSISIFIK